MKTLYLKAKKRYDLLIWTDADPITLLNTNIMIPSKTFYLEPRYE